MIANQYVELRDANNHLWALLPAIDGYHDEYVADRLAQRLDIVLYPRPAAPYIGQGIVADPAPTVFTTAWIWIAGSTVGMLGVWKFVELVVLLAGWVLE